jgi:hypothetical protein
MTINTTNTTNTTNAPKDLRPDAKSEPTAEPPATRKTQPGTGVVTANPEPDLESRIKTRRAELIVKLRELRADTRVAAAEAGDRLKAKLSEVSHIIKEGVVDGWSSLGDTVKLKLEHWLADAERARSALDAPTKNEQS